MCLVMGRWDEMFVDYKVIYKGGHSSSKIVVLGNSINVDDYKVVERVSRILAS